MEMQISTDTQDALFALEDLGPFAIFDQLTALKDRLPPPASMYLSGYLAALQPQPHPLDRARFANRDFADGFAAGQEIAAARRQMEAGHV